MKTVFVDCDVIIDLLTAREPHFHQSALFFQKIQDLGIPVYTSPLAIANVFYIVRKSKGQEQTKEIIKVLLSLIKLTHIDQSIVLQAIQSEIKDFEDAIQSYSSETVPCDYIVTRNTKDYKNAKSKAITPTEFNDLL